MKPYEKPRLLKETLSCSNLLCACVAIANSTETLQCGYLLTGTPYTVFLETWSTCMLSETVAPAMGFDTYCYQAGLNNVFSS